MKNCLKVWCSIYKISTCIKTELKPFVSKLVWLVEIERGLDEVSAKMCDTVAQNWSFRKEHLKRKRGQHLHETIFKK